MRIITPGLLIALALPMFATAAEPKRAVGTETISADGFAVLSVNVAGLWDAPELAGVRKALEDGKNPMLQSLKKELGFDLAEIERFTVSATASPFERGEGSPPVMYVTARKALDAAKFAKGLGAASVDEYRKEKPGFPEEIAGKNVYFAKKRIIVFVDERTVAFLETWGGYKGVGKFLDALKAGKPAQDGPLAEALALAPKHAVVASLDLPPIRKGLEAVGEPPAWLAPFLKVIQAERGTLTFDIGPKVTATAKLTFSDADTAAKAEPTAKAIFALGRKLLGEAVKDKKRDTETKAVVDPILGFFDAALDKAEAKLDGKVLTLSAGGEVDTALKKSLAAFPEWAAVTAARMQTLNNLKQIGIAMHSYHDANLAIPLDIVDKDGKAILSWRVELLPYLEQNDLYKVIDRTRAWDDPINKDLVEKMPPMFEVAGRKTKEKGLTYFQTFTAEKAIGGVTPFLVPGRKLKFTDVTDGTSNTLMVVEGATAVNWMKPGDLPFDPKKLPKIGNDGWMFALFGDGSVRRMRIPKDEVLQALITVDGGEVVNIDD